jgi:hypothetical protein
MTILYRGVIDVAALPILSVNDVIPPDAMAENEAKAVLGLE